MNREKKFIKNTLIITIGRLCTKMVMFLLLPLYTGILTTSEFGIYDLLNTLVSLLLPIITFEVEMAVFRELLEVRKLDKKKKEIISTCIISVLIQCLIFALLFLIIVSFINNKYKIYLFVGVIVSIFNSLFLQIARGLGDNTRYSIGSFIGAISTVILNIIFLVLFKLRVEGMLLGTIIGSIISTLYLFISLKLYKYLNTIYFRWKILIKLWKYSLPLIPNQISWWIFNVSDRLVVTIFLGLSFTGLLSSANKFSTLYTTIYGIVNLSWIENISLHINDVDIKDYYNKMFNIILSLFTSMAVILISLMPFIYPILINKKFNYAYGLVPILLVASIFYVIVSLTAVLYTANRNTSKIARTSIVSAIINLTSHLILLKYIGLYAAVVSTFLSYFIMAIYRLIDVSYKYFKIVIYKSNVLITLVVLGIVITLFYIDNIYLNIISLFISILFSWFMNKDSIYIIFNIISNKVRGE